MIADCIIVGGGIIGLLTAHELAQAGQKVVILERGEIGREASWAGGGILSPLHPWQTPLPVHALIHWSQAHYPRLAEELVSSTGVDPEWIRSGLLIFDTEHRHEALAWADKTGEAIEYIDRDRLEEIDPGAAISPSRALWLPEVAQIRNPRLLKALAISLARMDVDLCEHTEVHSLICRENRAEGVSTAKGIFAAGSVVIAAGAWSSALLHDIRCRPEIKPVRGQMLLYRTAPGFLQCIVLRGDCYLVPRQDGHLLVGSTVEHVGFDKSITEEARLRLEAEARRIIPGLANYTVVRQWAGLRPGSSRRIPFIGPHPEIKNLYVNSGHFRNGVAAGLGSARLLADLMLARTPIVPPHPFTWKDQFTSH